MTKKIFIKRELMIITKGVLCLMGVAVFSVCAILLPEIAREEAVGKVNHPPAYPFLIGAWILSIPIFFGLHQALKLLDYIDGNKAFSDLSVRALRNIKICAIVFSIMIIVGAITVIILARSADPREDVTPVVTIGFIFTFVSSVIATFTAVLQRLFKDAIHMKTENELTV